MDVVSVYYVWMLSLPPVIEMFVPDNRIAVTKTGVQFNIYRYRRQMVVD